MGLGKALGGPNHRFRDVCDIFSKDKFECNLEGQKIRKNGAPDGHEQFQEFISRASRPPKGGEGEGLCHMLI